VQLVQEGQEGVDSNIANDYMDEDSIVIVDSNEIEPKVLKIGDAQNSAKEVLSFMASHGSQGFPTAKLLMMERIRDKLTSNGIVHLTSTKQCDIRRFCCNTVSVKMGEFSDFGRIQLLRTTTQKHYFGTLSNSHFNENSVLPNVRPFIDLNEALV
jgi:hypothetical protein